MPNAIDVLQRAFSEAAQGSPAIGGFHYFAETLRQAGAIRNHWALPSCQSTFWTTHGNVVDQGEPLMTGFGTVPKFDLDAVIRAIREDQAGKSTFAQFLAAAWDAGVLSYEVDFENCTVSYFGVDGEVYVEEYARVSLGS